jgi:hypothetical protein
LGPELVPLDEDAVEEVSEADGLASISITSSWLSHE